jgi:regulator of PEP synthase PpsR (kinase-PPPase family)
VDPAEPIHIASLIHINCPESFPDLRLVEKKARSGQNVGRVGSGSRSSTPIHSITLPVDDGSKDSSVGRSYFHLHLVSDATGETLIAVSRAVTAQYQGVASIEHVYPLIRNTTQLDRAIAEIETAPGIVLFTLVDPELSGRLQEACKEIGIPCLSVLQPIFSLFESYLGTSSTSRPGAQHMLNAEYFKRIDALNFTMLHDDGQQPDNLEEADVLLLGVSRTSKTPTSIYLANRGIKTANIPLVPGVPLPPGVEHVRNPLVVGLVASPERIVQIRQNRLLALNADQETSYVDRTAVAEEINHSRRLCSQHGWPMIDVTRRSIEETAAAIIDLYKEHRLKFIAES